jgi:hypothetical protein
MGVVAWQQQKHRKIMSYLCFYACCCIATSKTQTTSCVDAGRAAHRDHDGAIRCCGRQHHLPVPRERCHRWHPVPSQRGSISATMQPLKQANKQPTTMQRAHSKVIIQNPKVKAQMLLLIEVPSSRSCTGTNLKAPNSEQNRKQLRTDHVSNSVTDALSPSNS